MMRKLGPVVAVAWMLVVVRSAAAGNACTDLRNLHLTRGAVALAAEVSDLGGVTVVEPTCRIVGSVSPNPRSDIHFEVWIPRQTWNGKYLQLGNGGFAGRIPYWSANDYLARGYAVGVTDEGHTSAGFTDAQWALGQPDKIRDFAFRAIKSTHDAALTVLHAYARHAPARSYFVGCSNGGREALQAAQRYPRDFDGIIAGAPAINMTSLLGGMGLLAQYLSEPGNELPLAKLPALQRAALTACAGDKDYVTDVEDCRFDPSVLACANGAAAAPGDECLTPQELSTVRRIYAGFHDLETGVPLPGPTPGAESLPGSWPGWILGSGPAKPSAIEEFSRNFYAFFVRGEPGFSIRALTLSDVTAGHAKFGALLDAEDPNLRQFAAHGGKLIQYHGGNDPGIPVGYSTDYFRKVQARMGDTQTFYRLFLVPGMLHCGGGAAPTQVDWLGALEAWVERGTPPDDLTANAAPAGATTQADGDREQRLWRYRAR